VLKNKGNIMKYNEVVNVDDVVLGGILDILNKSGEFKGTMTTLSHKLERRLNKNEANVLPKSASALRIVINRIINRLRTRRVKVNFKRSNNRVRTRIVEFKR